jgi:hypothetical protein
MSVRTRLLPLSAAVGKLGLVPNVMGESRCSCLRQNFSVGDEGAPNTVHIRGLKP